MSYSSPSSVAKLCKNLLGPEKTFTFSTCPTFTEVESWLSSGCSIIETVLTGHKYAAPVASGTVAYGWISDINTLYGAAMVEMARTNQTLSPDERSRGQVFWDMAWEQLDKIVSGKMGDLTLAGLSRVSVGTLYAGGTLALIKQQYESNPQFITPRFMRGQFDFPGTLKPNEDNSSDQNGTGIVNV